MFAEISGLTVAVILVMSVVTYVMKAGGLWLLNRIEPSETMRAGLEALPGGIIVALLAPELVQGGPAEWGGAFVVLVVAYRTDSVLLSLLVAYSSWCSSGGTELPPSDGG